MKFPKTKEENKTYKYYGFTLYIKLVKQMKSNTLIKNTLILLFLTFFIGTASADWAVNNTMKLGIIDNVGGEMHPTTFYYEDTLMIYFLSGAWEWSGSTWISNTELDNGLPTAYYFKPEVFTMDDTLYLIGGHGYTGAPSGWAWGGSTWVSYDEIATGLTDPASETFWDGDTLKLISYTMYDCRGWYWAGSTWIEDPSIVNGIVISHPDESYGYAVYQIGNELNLLQEDYTHDRWNGYTWDGSSWVANASISSGMTWPDVIMPIQVFILDNTYHAIATGYMGAAYAWTDGTYIAPFATPTPTPTPTPTSEPPVVAPPPFIAATPTPIQTPINEEENIITIIEEFIEKTLQTIDTIIRTIIGTTVNFILFIIMPYIGALLVQLKMKEEVLDTLLYGTAAWVLPLTLNIFIGLSLDNNLVGVIIFFLLGVATALIGNTIKGSSE